MVLLESLYVGPMLKEVASYIVIVQHVLLDYYSA